MQQAPAGQQRAGAPAGSSGHAFSNAQRGVFHAAQAPAANSADAAAAVVLVNRRQEGNPLLKCLRNVRWQYQDIIPDYQLGLTTCAIFLSLRFHLLKPEYIYHRIKQLQKSFQLRIILCYVDVDDVVEALGQVVKAALLNDCTLICGFSNEECARYLETVKVYETKAPDAIQGRTEEDYLSRFTAAITTVRGVNRTDVLTLGRTFGSLAGTMQATSQEMSTCPGIGPTKVRRLHECFHEPFRRALQQLDEVEDAAELQGLSTRDDGGFYSDVISSDSD